MSTSLHSPNDCASTLPPGLAVLRPETAIAAGASLSRSYRVNLNVLALVALFTGGLLVFSTQAHSVVRRRAQFALLRVLGVTRRRLMLLIVAEGALIGVVGSALGLALGFALAQIAVRWVGADLGSGFFRGVVPTLALEPVALGLFFVLGVAAAVAGSFAPALETARASPAQALKAGDEERAYARLRPIAPGLAVLALGAVATGLPPVAGLPLFGYAAIALLLIGTLMLMPRLTVAALSLLPAPDAPAPRLALAQLRGSPGQAAVSLAAIVASVSLTVSMVIMVASFRDSLDTWLERILPADMYFRAASGGDTAYLTPDVQAAIAALPGVRRAEFLREQQLLLDPARPRIVLQARTVDPVDPARNLPIIGATIRVAADAPPPVWVSEAAADLYGFAPGSIIALPIAASVERFTVAGVWRDYGRQQGAVAMERPRYVALTGDRTATSGALWLAGGHGSARGRGLDPARCPRRRAARDRAARRDSRRVADRVRPHVRGDLRAGARGGGDRSHRPVVVVRRAGARTPPRIRHAAPPRHDAAPDRRDARDRRPRGQRHRTRRRPGTRLRDQPGPDPRGEPAVVSLGHGARRCRGRRSRASACCCSGCRC